MCLHACLWQKHKYAYTCTVRHAHLCVTLITHSHTCTHMKSCTHPHVYASLNIHTGLYMSVYSCIKCMSMFNFFFRLAHTYVSTHIRARVLFTCAYICVCTHPCMQASPFVYAPASMPFAHTSMQSRTCIYIHAYTCFNRRLAVHHNIYRYVCSHVMAHGHTTNVWHTCTCTWACVCACLHT